VNDLLPFIIAGIVSGSIYGISAMGLALTYETSGIVNFAYGANAALAAGVFYWLHVTLGVAWPIAGLISILGVGIVLGLAMEQVGAVLVGKSTAMKVVATVAIMISLISVMELWYGFTAMPFPSYLPQGVVAVFGVNIGYDQIIIMVLGVFSLAVLTGLLRYTAFGRTTRAVIDDPVLVRLSGRSPSLTRRWSWIIGTTFASLSGVLIAPTVGLDSTALTLIVVQSLGAAAVGRFRSLPLAYVGALGIGIVGSISTKYAVTDTWLSGLPTSLPFIVLFVVLVCTPRRRLVDLGASLEKRIIRPKEGSLVVRLAKLIVVVAALFAVPDLVGARLSIWTQGLVLMLVFISLSLLVRTANQVSLCQLSFAAIGAVAFHRLLDSGVPWLVALVLAGLIVVPIGGFIAIPAIRLSGVYLALATLAFGILLEQQVYNTNLMFGGTGGASLPIPRPSFAQSDRSYFYFMIVVVVVVLGLMRAAEHGELGRLLRVRADSPAALTALGGSVRTPAVLAFCLSAFVAGLCGALIGPVFQVVGADSFSTVPTSLMVVALLVLSSANPGVRTLGISVLATVGLVILPAYLNSAQTQAQLSLIFGVAAFGAALEPVIGRPRFLARRNQSGSPEPHPNVPDAAPGDATSVSSIGAIGTSSTNRG
jgi:branched-subunit amino acid ABC-type transport system permease component